MDWTIASFNVNGLRARLGILGDWLAHNQPDAVCLQETKVQDQDFPRQAVEALGYHVVFHGQKSYNGVAILGKRPADEHGHGFGELWDDDQARLIWAKLDGLWVINVYAPQGRDPSDPAFAYKLEFFRRLRAWLEARFSPGEALVCCGDFNVAPQDIDLHDPVKLAGQVGCHPDERAAYADVLDWGLEDVFRRLHPAQKQFTFWDYRLRGALSRDLGWRIDHILASAGLAPSCGQCLVDMAPRRLEKPSDHTPIVARFSR